MNNVSKQAKGFIFFYLLSLLLYHRSKRYFCQIDFSLYICMQEQIYLYIIIITIILYKIWKTNF